MKLIYIAVFVAMLSIISSIGVVNEAYAAEKFITNQTVTYQILKWTNDDHVTNANLTIILDEAIFEWESTNPGLKFEKVRSNPDVEINWQNIQELGTATCKGECLKSDTIEYEIIINIGEENCLGEFTYMERDYIKRVTTHELGHTLGITHTLDRNSVMYEQIMYGGGFLKPVGFNDYNIPQSTMD